MRASFAEDHALKNLFFFYLKHATFSIEAFNRRIVQRYVHTDSPYADMNIILDGAYVPT